MIQHELIARVREMCRADERLRAALMYGSFAAGEGDEHSDIEFWLFFDPAARVALDPAAWCARVAPTDLVLLNEFGTHVALFPHPPHPAAPIPDAPGPDVPIPDDPLLTAPGPDDPIQAAPSATAPGPDRSGPTPGLIRGEFHFATTGDIASLAQWPARGAAVDEMVMVDRDGLLAPVLAALPERAAPPASPDEIADLCGRFANWLVLALHVTARGERLRARDALGHAARHLLWMARLAEDSTAHWLTPSRAAEAELPARTLEAVAEGGPVALWREGRDRWLTLLDRTGRPLPAALFARLDALTAAA